MSTHQLGMVYLIVHAPIFVFQNEKLEALLRDKDEELNRIRRQHSDDMSRRLEELRQLRESYELKMQEYEQLMDVKIQLDQEIATYRALLMEEENRFVVLIIFQCAGYCY